MNERKIKLLLNLADSREFAYWYMNLLTSRNVYIS